MRKLIPLLVFLTIPLIATSQTTPAKKPLAKKPFPAYAPPTAIIDTTAGKLRCELFPKKAPIGVANFIGLATGTKDWTNPQGKHVHGKPLYDGTIFHRVIPEFMIQGGDPASDGRGDPGYRFKNETSPDLTFDKPGRLAYANSGPDTNGSQFFITEVRYPSLDGHYTIFGQCDEPSVEIVKQIARVPRDGNDKPDTPVRINHITILHAGGMTHATMTHHPAKPRPTAPKPQ